MTKAGFDFVMPFGKHKGSKLGTLAEKESKYVMWMVDNNILSQGISNEVFETAYIVDNDLENADSDFYKNKNGDEFPDFQENI